MTVGNYLRTLLSEKHITPTQLCALTGIKSRNTLYRLFNGYHSTEKARSLIQCIMDAVEFSDSEKEQIYELLNRKKSKSLLHRVPSDPFRHLHRFCKSEKRFQPPWRG